NPSAQNSTLKSVKGWHCRREGPLSVHTPCVAPQSGAFRQLIVALGQHLGDDLLASGTQTLIKAFTHCAQHLEVGCGNVVVGWSVLDLQEDNARFRDRNRGDA